MSAGLTIFQRLGIPESEVSALIKHHVDQYGEELRKNPPPQGEQATYERIMQLTRGPHEKIVTDLFAFKWFRLEKASGGMELTVPAIYDEPNTQLLREVIRVLRNDIDALAYLAHLINFVEEQDACAGFS